MSDFADKLEPQRRSTSGRAQATKKQLLGRWGSREVDAGLIWVESMGRREVWRRLSGDVFEQMERS